MITVSVRIAADNTNVLSGTDLASAPGDGVYEIYAAASQNDWLITVSAGGQNVVRAAQIPMRTNGVPSLVDDPPLAFPVLGGTTVVVNVDITTAGSGYVVARFHPIDEL